MKTKLKKKVIKHIAFTPDQWKVVNANAEAAGVDLKTYMKNQLLNGRPCPGREPSPTVNITQVMQNAKKSQ